MRYHQLPILLLQNLPLIWYCCVKQFHNFYRLEAACECIYKLDVFIQGQKPHALSREYISLGAEVCDDAMHKYQRPALCCRLVDEQPGGQQPLLIMSKLIIHVCSCSTISRFLRHSSWIAIARLPLFACRRVSRPASSSSSTATLIFRIRLSSSGNAWVGDVIVLFYPWHRSRHPAWMNRCPGLNRFPSLRKEINCLRRFEEKSGSLDCRVNKDSGQSVQGQTRAPCLGPFLGWKLPGCFHRHCHTS